MQWQGRLLLSSEQIWFILLVIGYQEEGGQILPEFRHLSLKLLFTAQVLIHLLRYAGNPACPTFVDREFLVVTLKLTSELFYPLLQVGLARLSANKRFACFRELLGLINH